MVNTGTYKDFIGLTRLCAKVAVQRTVRFIRGQTCKHTEGKDINVCGEKNQRFVNDTIALSNCYFTSFFPVASVILR